MSEANNYKYFIKAERSIDYNPIKSSKSMPHISSLSKLINSWINPGSISMISIKAIVKSSIENSCRSYAIVASFWLLSSILIKIFLTNTPLTFCSCSKSSFCAWAAPRSSWIASYTWDMCFRSTSKKRYLRPIFNALETEDMGTTVDLSTKSDLLQTNATILERLFQSGLHPVNNIIT